MNRSKFMPTLITDTCEAFKQSLISFVENDDFINENHPPAVIVEKFVLALEEASGAACRTGLVDLIEGYEVEEDTVTRDGKPYHLKTCTPKKLLSRFGEIVVTRKTFHNSKGGKGLVPLDEKIAMKGRYVMPDVVEFILYGSGMLKPTELAGMFEKTNQFNPSASLIQDIINQDGQAFGNFLDDANRLSSVREIKAPDVPVKALVGSFDGANLLVREPGKKRGARVKKPSKEGVHSEPIEKSCSYKNAMVGSISFYDVAEVIDFETQEPRLQPDRIKSSYIGRMPEERYPKFKAEFEHALSQAEDVVPDNIVKILLMDGARGFWSYVDDNPLYDAYIKVVDFYHTAEHLSRLAEAVFGKSSKAGQQWYEKWVSKIKHDANGVASMVRSAGRYAKERRLSQNKTKDLNTELTFFKRNQSRMPYASLVEQGFPIGSGPVEAACKMIVKNRFCQSGMRWSIQGGQNVMNLRVVQKSDQWDDTWKQFKEAGGYRNYQQKAA